MTPTQTQHPLDDNAARLMPYGISVQGLSEVQTGVVLQAAELSGSRLAPIVGVGSPERAFIMSFGTIVIIVDPTVDIGDRNEICITRPVQPDTPISPSPYWDVVQYEIVCRQAPNLTTILHEFWHAFDLHYRDRSSDSSNNLLSNYLSPLEVNGVPIRYTSLGIRTPIGFKGIGSPARENFWTDSLLEEFADTGMNFTLDGTGVNVATNGFSNDAFGNARRSEFQQLLELQWLPYMDEFFSSFDR